MNLRLLVPLFLAALLARPAAGGETLREQSQRVLDATGIAALRVDNSRGLIRVGRSADGRIHLTALKIARSTRRERAARYARETEVSVATEGGRCSIRVRYPQRETVRVSFWEWCSGLEMPAIEVRLALEVPASLPVTLRSTSGDIETDGLDGPQDLETTSGDVSATRAGGPLRAGSTSGDVEVDGAAAALLRTVSGDVLAANAAGALDAHTTSGDLVVRGAADSLALGTVSGNIRVDRAPRGVRATTTSGDIEVSGAAGAVRLGASSGDIVVRLAPGLSNAEISTASGDIDARLAEGLGCAVELRTSNGTLDVSVPLEVKTVTRHLVIGRVRQGTTAVSLRTSSGDIHLVGGGNR